MSSTAKSILITTLIAGVIITGVIVITKSIRKKVTKKSYSIRRKSEALITIPATPFKKFDLIVVYGGLHYANPDWMFQQVLNSTPDLLYSNIIVFLPYSYSITKTNELLATIDRTHPVDNYSIIGFSKGGENVVTLKNSRKWRFVGLIDPAIGWLFDQRRWGKESHMTYGSKAMMDIYEKNGSRYTKLKKLIEAGRGTVEKTVTNHKNSPSAFFIRFKNKIDHGA